MDIEKKKRLEKKLTIGFQIFAIIGLIVIGFYLGKAYKARKENKEKKEQETIKDFGTKFEEFKIDSENNKYSITLDGKEVIIENKTDGVYLNDKKIDFSFAMGGYVLDKSLLLYSVGQVGYGIIFIDKDLSIIPLDNSDASYRDLKLVDGKIEATVDRYNNAMSCNYINNLEICNCNETSNGDPLTKYKNELEPLKNEVITGNVKLSYNGEFITTEYTNQQTIWDLYGKDIEGSTKIYCVQSHKGDE